MGEEEATVEAGWHSKGDLCVGGLPGKYAWDGEIDEVCLYATTIDQDKVRATMNEPVRSDGGKEDPVIGHWSFNEGAGEHASDASSNKNHGSLEGGVQRVLSTLAKAMDARQTSIASGLGTAEQWVLAATTRFKTTVDKEWLAVRAEKKSEKAQKALHKEFKKVVEAKMC